jgi:hypothetical protein
MLDPRFVILGAVFNLIGSTNYAWSTLRGHTQPNRVTWFLWALAPLIAFAAELGEGVGLQSVMTFMVGFGPALVLIASFLNPNAYWKISRFDLICGGLSMAAIVLWLITRSGNAAILFTILADGLAGAPTLVKAYRFPETENYRVFMFAAISAFITLLTIDTWNFAHYGFPLYIFIICSIFFILIKFPNFRPGKFASVK